MKEKNGGAFSSALDKLKWALYGLKIKIFKPGTNDKKADKGMASRTMKKNIFLFFFLLLPTVQFLIFYIGVNFNSILLSIQKYDAGKYVISGFGNFADVFKDLFINGRLSVALKNSTIQFGVTLALGIPVHVMVAYAIFKEVPFGGFLKIMLFMPNMISSLLFVNSFRGMTTEQGLIPIIGINLLDTSSSVSFWTVLLFAQWMGFAGGLIIYLSAMSSISTEVLEYGQLEPLSSIKELWYVIVPSIFPTITTYLVLAIAGYFTNYGYFHTFFGGAGINQEATPYETLGYYFFVALLKEDSSPQIYPYASAAGIMFTLVAAPITLLVKHLLEKYGPSEE